MSLSCLVCLGDLEDEHSASGPPIGAADVPSKASDPGGTPNLDKSTIVDDIGLIARINPCGHLLHDFCLRPWVEQANSCPLCRQTFNSVSLSHTVGSDTISTYEVEDRVQYVEPDESLMLQYALEEDRDTFNCSLCGVDDNPDVLLLCEGCNCGYHTYCLGYDSVPADDFWCDACVSEGLAEQGLESRSAIQGRDTRQTRHQNALRGRNSIGRRRGRNPNANRYQHWESVWQSVWDHLDIDLDDPSEEEEALSQYRRTFRSRRLPLSPQAAWEARQNVAEEQGGTDARFEDTRPALLNRYARRRRTESPPHQTEDETRAWDAYEKARTEQDPPSTQKRKRRSKPNSPVESESSREPERKLKRPNTKATRRALESGEPSSAVSAVAGTAAQSNSTGSSSNPISPSAGPSFLQSLLQPYEGRNGLSSDCAMSPSGVSTRSLPQISTSTSLNGRRAEEIGGHANSASSMPSSPSASSHPSPQAGAGSTPPLSPASTRPVSPFSLTSRVEPIFPEQIFSPSSPTSNETSAQQVQNPRGRSRDASRDQSSGRQAPQRLSQSPPEHSPERTRKADIQKMVKRALAPHYHGQHGLSKELYTDINRSVSRMLYEKIGDSDIIALGTRSNWEKLAMDEVSKAVAVVQRSSA